MSSSELRAVGLVQHPEHRELLVLGGRRRRAAVEPPLAELRLALRERFTYAPIVLEDVEDLEHRLERFLERLGPDEVEVVRRRVVLRELALARAAQAADGEVEPGRVELALVPAPRDEVERRGRRRAAPSTCAAARSTSASPRRLRLYVSGAGVADAGEDEPGRRSVASAASFRASQVIEPIVPGMNRRRYESARDARPAAPPSSVSSAMPERLSFASDGWQT